MTIASSKLLGRVTLCWMPLGAGRFLIEMAPVPDADGARRGVVAEGPVGVRRASCFRLFRYELRRWPDDVISEERHATSTVVGVDLDRAERLFGLVPSVPTLVWGRDDLGAGEMSNSNSVTSWLLEQSRFDTTHLVPPASGRAPGWPAGLVVARRGEPASFEGFVEVRE